MIEMGFPKEWSNDFLDRVTYYEPWLKERYERSDAVSRGRGVSCA